MLSETHFRTVQKSDANKATERTRRHLIAASSEIFAKVGYQAATTRQICQKARANAASVNYHFGDKLGLYTAVLKASIKREEERIRVARQSLLKVPPQQALAEFISMMFDSMAREDLRDSYARIMAQGLSDPTPRLALVVQRIIRPRALFLCEIVSQLTGHPPGSQVTRLCANSVIGQVLHYTRCRSVTKLLWPEWLTDEAGRRDMAAHVAAFSLAAMKRKRREQ
jgi:AcrR family transcriptional regulator